MHIRFAEADENFIKAQVENGFYTNETELVRDAVRRMREEKARAGRFYAAVMEGVEAIERGEVEELTPELWDQIKKEGFAKAKAGEPYHSDMAVPFDL